MQNILYTITFIATLSRTETEEKKMKVEAELSRAVQCQAHIIYIPGNTLQVLGQSLVLRLCCCCCQNFSITLLKTILQLSIAGNQHILLISRHQAHLGIKINIRWLIEIVYLVRDASIQPVEVCDNMSHVKEWSPILHHLVEHVISEQLQHVPEDKMCH